MVLEGNPFAVLRVTKCDPAPADEAVVGPDPEIAFAVFEEAVDRRAGQMRGSLLVIDDELHAVETDEAALGSKPDVAVPCLSDGVDGVLREPAIGLP